MIAPFEWQRSPGTALQPDVLVARHADLLAAVGSRALGERGRFLGELPVLAVEVGRPSGVQEWCAAHPFVITIRPTDLVAGLRCGDPDDG